MKSIKRLGILYGRLGLSTDAGLIERRAAGVKASADALTLEDLPAVLRTAFGLGRPSEADALLEKFGQDPTFDVRAGDEEAHLLAAAVLDYEIENETNISATVALAVMTTAIGGRREAVRHDGLIQSARDMLAYFQGGQRALPKDRTYSAIPKKLTDAIQTVAGTGGGMYNQNMAPTAAALSELAQYAESNASNAAGAVNVVLRHIEKLEEELQVYWWVSGGWSAGASTPFRRMDIAEAALRCGYELAEKDRSGRGLFAAPALIDQVLERGRTETSVSTTLKLVNIASSGSNGWRREAFAPLATGPFADLLPVSTALGLSGESDDADDWHPRYKRLTGLDATTTFDPVELGLQVYREYLLNDALS